MILLVLYIISAFVINLILPWWSIVIPGIVLGYWYKSGPAEGFGLGFLSLFLLWGAQSVYINQANEGLLAGRIAEMLQVGEVWIVILATAVIGGIVGGLAVMTGSMFSETSADSKVES